MKVKITPRIRRNKQQTYYTLEWGKGLIAIQRLPEFKELTAVGDFGEIKHTLKYIILP